MSRNCSVSVIIPVFHEESTINSAIRALRTHQPVGLCEIIVVDGSPGGETLAALEDEGVKRVLSSKGRGCQMNEGARHATGEILLFLHADTTLPPGGLERLASTMDTGAFVGGAFDLAIDSEALSMKLIARAACARSRFTRLPYGDQALFFERE
ncbi:MAG TPA: glycosyltransferase, partial [Candidatus Methylomirabilis sp.]